jgi:parvulin-like peptidyl-prolyl isomerase
VAAVEQQAVADATTESPSAQALRSYYDAHKESYATEGTMTVRDLLLNGGRTLPPRDAAAAIGALRGGVAAAEVMQRYALRELRPNQGEEFYFAAKIHMGERLFDAAKLLGDGAVSEPISLADGIHVLCMIKNVPPVPRLYEQAREQVLTDYKRAAAERLRAADEKYLYGKADIQIAPALK